MTDNNNNLTSKSSDKVRFDEVNILLVEDNIVNQMIANENLKVFGCNVDVAVNGEEAITKLQDSVFDLILMDCLMPIMDGYQATAEIRQQELDIKCQANIIIAFTANTSELDIEKCYNAGMDDYLAKPLVTDELEKKLIKWLPNKQSPSIEGLVFTSYEDNSESENSVQVFNKEAFYSLKKIFGDKFPDAVIRYTKSITDNVQSINEAVVNNDLQSLEQYTHTLKGLSAQFGAIELSALSRTLEDFAKNGELVQVKNKLQELSLVHEKVEGLINRTMILDDSKKNSA